MANVSIYWSTQEDILLVEEKNPIYLLSFICMFHFPNFEAIMEDVKMGIKNLRTYLTGKKFRILEIIIEQKCFMLRKEITWISLKHYT